MGFQGKVKTVFLFKWKAAFQYISVLLRIYFFPQKFLSFCFWNWILSHRQYSEETNCKFQEVRSHECGRLERMFYHVKRNIGYWRLTNITVQMKFNHKKTQIAFGVTNGDALYPFLPLFILSWFHPKWIFIFHRESFTTTFFGAEKFLFKWSSGPPDNFSPSKVLPNLNLMNCKTTQGSPRASDKTDRIGRGEVSKTNIHADWSVQRFFFSFCNSWVEKTLCFF